jgi:hypothetical protein
MTFLQKTLFVILNGVKDLLLAMLLRPVQPENRCFTPFSMTRRFKESCHLNLHISQIVILT